MRALVTGCAGFIGSHLTESLLDDGHEVVGVDCFNDNYARKSKLANLRAASDWDGFEFIPIDLAQGDLADLVSEVDVVFHQAAEPGVRPSWSTAFERYLRNNVLATQQLLEALRREPSKRLVYASSSSVYGQAERWPTPEDALPRPYSPYGVTKLAAERLCDLYHHNHGLNVVSLRYFSVYGPRQRPDMAFRIFCERTLGGEAIEIYGDGTQTRDFTYVDDVVRANRLAVTAPGAAGEVINIGGGSDVSLLVTLELLREISGLAIEAEYLPPQPGDVRSTRADVTRARDMLDFEPSIGIEEGLRREFEWVLASRTGVGDSLR